MAVDVVEDVPGDDGVLACGDVVGAAHGVGPGLYGCLLFCAEWEDLHHLVLVLGGVGDEEVVLLVATDDAVDYGY